jgi:hypothetical protein
VVGDRVYLQSSTLKSYASNGTEFASWRTYVCLIDNSSTTSPEEDSINWIEAGTSREYPYHSVDGNLVFGETYLEAVNNRWKSSGINGSLWHHLRRDESTYSLGRMIIVSDKPNPIFKTNLNAAVIGFSIEPEQSIKKFTIVCINSTLGSAVGHNDQDSMYGKIDKCDIYKSGSDGNILGSIYNNLNKIEFTDCLFSERASDVGYGDMTNSDVYICSRAFFGFKRCSFFFPSKTCSYNFLYDSQVHSVGQESFIESCSFWFKSFTNAIFLRNIRAGVVIKDNIFYFSESAGQEITILSSNNGNVDFQRNVLYIGDNSATFNTLREYSNVFHEDYSEKIRNINPKLVLNDDPSGLQLRPSSPLIGGIYTAPSANNIFYVDSANGDDANDGTSPENAVATISQAVSISLNNDTIYIVDEEITLASQFSFGAGRKYLPLTKCHINGADTYNIDIAAPSDLETEIKGFKFKNLRGQYGLLELEGSSINSILKIENCLFEGIVVNARSAAIGGSSTPGCRAAAGGSYIKNSTISCAWGSASTGGLNSSGFVAIDRMDLLGCTFYVGSNTPVSSALYLVGQGGVGSWSHGPPYGPIIVRDCIVHGNGKMNYGYYSSGNGGNLGFTSNARVTVSQANYVIANSCLYGINGSSFDDPSSTNTQYLGTIYIDIPSNVLPLNYQDPRLIDPEGGIFNLRSYSHLVGGINKRSFSADAIWMQTGSGTGTGTDSDPYYFSQFNEATLAAASTSSKQIIMKDGTYVFTTGGGQLVDTNLPFVTFVAENKHQAIIKDNGRLNIGALTSQVLRLKDIYLWVVDHFIWNVPGIDIYLKGCYVKCEKYISCGQIFADECIIEQVAVYAIHCLGEFNKCLFIDRRQNGSKFNTQTPTFRNCIFAAFWQQSATPVHSGSTVINCASYNFDVSSYNDSEIIFDGDPLMIKFHESSHEDSNYSLRPKSPLIGKGI